MRKFLVLFSFLTLSNSISLFAQKSVDEDSLVSSIKDRIRSNGDSVEFYLDYLKGLNSQYASSNYYFLSGYEKMKQGQFEEAILTFKEFIKQEKDSTKEGSIDQLNRIAMCFKYLGSDSSIYYYKKAIKIASTSQYLKGEADGYSGIGMVLELKSDYNEAIELYLKAYDLFVEQNDSLGISSTLNNIGNVMYYQGNYPKALNYYKKSASIDRTMNNEVHLASSYGNIGMIYNLMEVLDSSLLYNIKCMKIFEGMKEKHNLGTIYNNVALVYFELEDYKKSLQYHEKSLEIKKEIGDKNGLATSFVNIGNLKVILKDYQAAKTNYMKGLELAKEIDSRVIEMDAHKGLSKVYQSTGDYNNALNEFIIYGEIKDSLNDIKNKNKIAELENSFELKNKANIIQQLESQSKLNEVQVDLKTSQRNVIFGIAVLIFILFIFSLFYWKQRQSIHLKNIALNDRKIKLLMKDNEMNYTKAMIEGEENERKRIAQDLHDRLGDTLSTIKLRLSSSSPDRIEKTKEMLDEAVEEVRKISHNLASISLIQFGLIASIESLSKSISSNHLKIEFIHHGIDERLPTEITIPIYRVIQELISNIIKHAKATKVTIQIQRNLDQLNVIVEDNGKGFDTDKEFEGMGLKNVQSRINLINGKLDFDSSPFSGTRVIIDIPIES